MFEFSVSKDMKTTITMIKGEFRNIFHYVFYMNCHEIEN